MKTTKMQSLSIKIGLILVISSLAITVFTACEKTTDTIPQLMLDLTKSNSSSDSWNFDLPIPEQYYVTAEAVNVTTATSKMVTWENTGETFELQVEINAALSEESIGMHSITISGEIPEDFKNELVLGPIDDFINDVITCAEGCKSLASSDAVRKCLVMCFWDTLGDYYQQLV